PAVVASYGHVADRIGDGPEQPGSGHRPHTPTDQPLPFRRPVPRPVPESPGRRPKRLVARGSACTRHRLADTSSWQTRIPDRFARQGFLRVSRIYSFECVGHTWHAVAAFP